MKVRKGRQPGIPTINQKSKLETPQMAKPADKPGPRYERDRNVTRQPDKQMPYLVQSRGNIDLLAVHGKLKSIQHGHLATQ
jgi:hypothetical protein